MNAIPKRKVTTRAVSGDEELHLAHDLMAKAHVPNYFSSMNWLESSALSYPGFRAEHTRVALMDGQIAGALRLTTDTIRLGEARLKVGGLGWVTTAPERRHRGVCSALLEDTLGYMRQHGYHVSMLFGIPNFYHRFGYATTLAEFSIVLDIAELPDAPSGEYRARPVKPGDIPALQRIFSVNNAGVPCSMIRSAAHLTNKWHRIENARVFTNAQGKVEGYVVAHAPDGLFEVTEAGFDSPSVVGDLLAYCSATAQESYRPRVRFTLPPEHPLAHWLTRYESTHEMKLTPERGGMMTFVDVGETLENLIPEWESRIAVSGLLDERAEATLIVDNAPFRVRAHHGAIDVIPSMGKNRFAVSSVDLMRLVTGYTHFEDIYQMKRRLMTSDARLFLTSLFPKRNPYVHLFDRF